MALIPSFSPRGEGVKTAGEGVKGEKWKTGDVGVSDFYAFPSRKKLSRGGWGIDRRRLSPYNRPRIPVGKGGGRREEPGCGLVQGFGPFGSFSELRC